MSYLVGWLVLFATFFVCVLGEGVKGWRGGDFFLFTLSKCSIGEN